MGKRDHLLCLFLPEQTHSKLIISEEQNKHSGANVPLLLMLTFEEKL
jgi:hypothetical protein